MSKFVVGVDVGTGSARAGVFSRNGQLMAKKEHPIAINRPVTNHVEQNSEDIWRAVCLAVQGALQIAGVKGGDIEGISFDATCSLVVRDKSGAPLTVSTTGENRWDTIVWLDHRALAEADECSALPHKVLDYVGGTMSPEMEIPKLMWLKRNLPDTWRKAGYFFDLADYLTWRASGSNERSECTLTCKWTYLAHEDHGWQYDFLEAVGLADMPDRGNLPPKASPIGKNIGTLDQAAADQLGLTTKCQVGVGLIDAHSGALGVVGGFGDGLSNVEEHLALIAGTSSCVMALSQSAKACNGVWGPYYGAVLPGYWLNEGGQSVTGALLDHVIRWHPAGGQPTSDLHARICERIMDLRSEEGYALASRLHVLPDFHGNRSPLADPHALGVISGLDLDLSFDNLCRLYWRTAISIALGVRHILEALNAAGFVIENLHVTGGHTKNPLLMELYADATGCTVIEPAAEDAVLLGTAMVAATAAGWHADLASSALAMHQGETSRRPNPKAMDQFDRDYKIFLKMHEQRRILDQIN